MNDFEPFLRFGLLLVRPGTLVMAAPPFGAPYAPMPVRLGLTLLFTLTLMPVVAAPSTITLIELVVVVAREMAIGLAIALGIRALMGGAELAGHLSGYQLGFSYGAIVDPQSGVRNSMFAALYSNMALIVFFAVDGHHALLRAMAASYTQLPIGIGHVDGSVVVAVTSMLGIVFVLGVRLAMPLILVLMVVEVALGLIARAAPAINLMAVAQPLRILIGLLVIASIIGITPGLIGRYITPALEAGMRGALAFR
ncbi:MAG: flagellar biosynthetic protein FliR [Vicinamibacterales bacterium]